VLAPKSARFAFLSATIPNAREFAEWVAKVGLFVCNHPCSAQIDKWEAGEAVHCILMHG